MEIEKNNNRGEPYGNPNLCVDNFCEAQNRIRIIHTIINFSLYIILIIGLILISYLIYRKYKGKKGLRWRLILWNLIFCTIIFFAWVVVDVVFSPQPELIKSTI